MSDKPSIVIVPGAMGIPEFYDPVVNLVRAQGYEIKGLHLPSVNPNTGLVDREPTTMYDDAAFIAKEVEKLADEGKNIVLVPHSYGGVPTTESTKGLSRAERQAQGKPGGIVRLAYMTCLVPAMGMPAAAVLGEVPEEQQIGMKIDEKGFLYHEDIARAADLCFTDMSPEEGMAWIKRFPRHSSVSFGGPLTHAGYKDIPVSYLVCENDRCIPPDHQRKGIDLIEKVSGRKVDVSSLQGDHCAPAYNGQEVSQWLLAVARKS